MASLDTLKTFPIGSILLQPEPEAEQSLIAVSGLLPGLKTMVASPKTAAYLRGLTKQYNLPVQSTQRLALSILQIAIGKLQLASLPALLSGELKLANDKAQQMAREIEKDIFAPVMLELNQGLAQQQAAEKQGKSKKAQSAGARNVLNLDRSDQQTPLRPASSSGQAAATPPPVVPQAPKPKRPVLPLPPRRRPGA